jgi:glycerol-3-phosphate dehydrogenase
MSESPGEAQDCDVLVVGGGINGAAIARDAAGRGLRVQLYEQADLAGYTSSCSTKLIHGGLRYLEFGQIALVRKALQERQVLLRAAPHLVRPLRLLLVHDASMRPAWMLRAGLWMYDHLGGQRRRFPLRAGSTCAAIAPRACCAGSSASGSSSPTAGPTTRAWR